MAVFDVALDFLEFADRIEPAVRRRKRWLNEDFQAAAVSILANIGQGATELSVKDKKRFYRYALRSTGECSALLHGIERLRLIPAAHAKAGKALLLSLRIHLLRLLRSSLRPAVTQEPAPRSVRPYPATPTDPRPRPLIIEQQPQPTPTSPS